MKKYIVAILLLAVITLSAGGSGATDIAWLGGNLNINLLVNATNVALKDGLDSIYLGTVNSETKIGFGGEASLFYPVSSGIKAGPHFIFNYSPLRSSWHDFQLFQTSLGGIVDFNLGGGNSVSAFVDYNLGWFAAQQEIAGVAGTPAPAGNFAGGIPGFMLGLKTYTRVTDNIGVGLYYQYGLSMALTGIKYLSSSGSNAWMDAAISFSQFGGTIYF